MPRLWAGYEDTLNGKESYGQLLAIRTTLAGSLSQVSKYQSIIVSRYQSIQRIKLAVHSRPMLFDSPTHSPLSPVTQQRLPPLGLTHHADPGILGYFSCLLSFLFLFSWYFFLEIQK